MLKLLRDAQTAREALWLTLALFVLVYIVFTLPALIAPTHYAAISYAGDLVSPLPGLALFPVAYLVIRATVAWSRATRAVVLSTLVLVCAAIHAAADLWLLEQFFALFVPGARLPVDFSINLIIYVWVYGFFVAVVGLLISSHAARARERLLAEARAAAQQAQLAALRFQLNPHFLFNTLNAISSLIIARRNDEAEAMMEKLCDFLRATLACDPQQTISLAAELDTVVAYLDIEKVRFGERLSIAIDCPPELGRAAVPSFLLQPVVENAIKYAVAPAQGPVEISLAVRPANEGRALHLVVTDRASLPLDTPVEGGAGVGLSNIRSRLDALYGDRGGLQIDRYPGGYRCTISLPLQTLSAPAAA